MFDARLLLYVICCVVFYCFVLFWIVLCCITVLFCFVLFCVISSTSFLFYSLSWEHLHLCVCVCVCVYVECSGSLLSISNGTRPKLRIHIKTRSRGMKELNE